MDSSCHIGVTDNDRNRYKTWAYQNIISMLVALTKMLTFLKSRKIITFSHLNSTNFNNNFKVNFMREKVNKMTLKAKPLNVCMLEPN